MPCCIIIIGQSDGFCASFAGGCYKGRSKEIAQMAVTEDELKPSHI
jgi:hypothetical protein